MGEIEDAHACEGLVVLAVRSCAGALRCWTRRRAGREAAHWLRRRDMPRRFAEAVRRPRAAHRRVAERVGVPPAARFELGILRHLVDGQHPAVRRVPFLRLEEQLLYVPRRHPLPQHLHHAPNVGAAIGRLLVLGVEQVLLRLLLDEPDQLVVEVRRRRDHDAAASRRHHDVGVRPMQAAATFQHRPGRVRQVALVPDPHEHVLQARRDALVDGNRAVVASARSPPPMERRKHGDGRVGAGEDEVQLAEGLERRRVRIAGRGDGAAERAGDEIRREMVAPRAVRPERRDVDHHQFRSLPLRLRQLRRIHREGAGAGHHHVGLGHQRRQPLLAGRRGQVQFDLAAARGEERMPQRRAVGVEERAATAQRVAAGGRRAHHVGAEIGQQLGTVDGAFVGEIEHAEGVQRTRLGHRVPSSDTRCE